MKRMVIQLSEDLYDRLREEAFRQRVSQAELVRRAVRDYFAHLMENNGKARKSTEKHE